MTRIDRTRNKVIRETTQTGMLGEKVREVIVMVWTCAEAGQWILW